MHRLLAIAVGLVVAAAPAADPPRRPNVIVLFTDDQGYADLSSTGCKDYRTPHLDSLAADGVRCTAGYVSQCQCSPSRAGMLTGRHQSRFGHEENPGGGADPKQGLPTDQKTLADYLKQAGYATGHVGKWHQGSHPKFAPLKRGFAESFTHELSFDTEADAKAFAADRQAKFRGVGGKYGFLARDGVPGPSPVKMPGYVADAYADEVVGFIDRHKAEPFFLYWAHPFPHVPQIADAKYLKRVEHIPDEARRVYAAMMLAVDDGVGRMLAALKKNGLDEHTLIFYMSDNGGPSDGRLPCFNTPYRGNKGGLLEGGIRVPYFVRWTGTLPAGKAYDRPVSTLDIVPTALAAAGAKPPTDRVLDGVNLLPYLKDGMAGDPHERLYWRYLRRNLSAVREGDWKLIKQRGKNATPELYDLAADPGEATDLAAKNPEKVNALLAAYNAWAKDLPEPLWKNGAEE